MSRKVENNELFGNGVTESEKQKGFKEKNHSKIKEVGIMRNTEKAIPSILSGGIIGYIISYLFLGNEYGFLGALIGGIIGYIMSQRR